MKLLFQNRTLTIAVVLSILVHGTLLAVRFAAPNAFHLKPADPGLEVILVNSKHDKKPLNAEALAQANLDGGGNAEAGRAKSPLPDMHRSEDGASLKESRRRIEELEQQQQRMLEQLKQKTSFTTSVRPDANTPRDLNARPNGTEADESEKAFSREVAEIAKNVEDYNKRPKKTFISPSTREENYAMYFDNVRQRIEKYGTLHFPQKDGKRIYGELTLSISVFQNGTIYTGDRDQGVTVERSSGNSTLDEMAKGIVRKSAPFGAFPKKMRSTDKDDVWVMTTRFKFTREDGLEAVLQERRN